MARKGGEDLNGNLFGVSILVFCGVLIEFFPGMNHWLKAFLCLSAVTALVLGEKIWVWGNNLKGAEKGAKSNFNTKEPRAPRKAKN